ncbi:MAG: SPOR domain-containing protein [Nitrospinae bacterium]|nr:SPOR domain-containing protein [Nitrospinota bacterium]
MAENDVKPDDDSSLDQFEQKLIEEEKKKARKNFIVSIVVLAVVTVAGFIVYGKMGGKEQAQAPLPPPPVPKAAEPKPEAPPPVPAEVKPAAPAVKTAAPKAPAPAAKKEEKTPAKPTKAAAPATTPKKEEKPAVPAKAAPAKQPAPAPAAKPESKAPAHPGEYTIQLGVFTEEANVKKLTDRLGKIGLTPELGKRTINVKSIVVTTNKYRYRELAEKDAKKLAAEGYKNTVRITGPGSYAVEVGRYSSSKEADAAVKKLEDKGYTVHVDFTAVKAEGTVVLISGIPDAGKLEEVTEKLKGAHLDFFVIKR